MEKRDKVNLYYIYYSEIFLKLFNYNCIGSNCLCNDVQRYYFCRCGKLIKVCYFYFIKLDVWIKIFVGVIVNKV